jgi:predicted 3-demethylubiquinone-9 3-methyltransferase (glyoxalase superfamily)
MQKITPFLWLDSQAEQAAEFYTSVFEDSEILGVMPGPGGSAMSATVRIHGQELILFNGGPHFRLSEAVSLFVTCETQDEIDDLWEKLTDGGEESRCGWLKDKFGLSWQIIPPVLGQMLQDEDPAKVNNVMQAMLKMSKLDIAVLQEAYNQTN